jgi:hypothetical protein
LVAVCTAGSGSLGSSTAVPSTLTHGRCTQARQCRDQASGNDIVVQPTEDLLRLQQKIIDVVTPFTEKTGTVAAFASTEEGRDIQAFLIEYVGNFVSIGTGR